MEFKIFNLTYALVLNTIPPTTMDVPCLHELEDQVRNDARAALSLFSSLTGLSQPLQLPSMPEPVNIDEVEPIQRLHQLQEQIRFLDRITNTLFDADAELGLYDDQALWIPPPQLNTDMRLVLQLARPAHGEITAEPDRVI